METEFITVGALITGFVLDQTLGDPVWFPHPVVGFGRITAWLEHRLNKGSHRFIKGGIMTIILVVSTFSLSKYCLSLSQNIHPAIAFILNTVIVFSCLSALTL